MINKNNFKSKNQSGFTLLEILIVIIILGILAALAIPVYSAVKEKAVKQEAYQQLAAIREAQQRYASAYQSYTTSIGALGYDPNAVTAGVSAHYSYTIPTGDATTMVAVATRLTSIDPTPPSAYSITIDQAGTITGG